MKKFTWILPALAVLLFAFNYLICELVYGNDIESWWDLRNNISAVVVLLAFYCARLEKTPIVTLVTNIGIGFSMADVIDRVFFDIMQFTKSDILMIVVTITYSIYNYVRQRR